MVSHRCLTVSNDKRRRYHGVPRRIRYFVDSRRHPIELPRYPTVSQLMPTSSRCVTTLSHRPSTTFHQTSTLPHKLLSLCQNIYCCRRTPAYNSSPPFPDSRVKNRPDSSSTIPQCIWRLAEFPRYPTASRRIATVFHGLPPNVCYISMIFYRIQQTFYGIPL